MSKTLFLSLLGLSLGVFALAVAALSLTGSVEFLGRNVPQADILSDYAFGVLWAALLGTSIYLWPIPQVQKGVVLLLWIAKSFVVLVVMLFYESHYAILDSYSYFLIPTLATFDAYKQDFAGSTEVIFNLAWLHHQILPESFHALKVSFAYTGLVAIYILYRAVVMYLREERISILLVLALFPSILFWSSILGKDPIVLLGISIFIYGVVGWYREKTVKAMLVVACALVLVVIVRPWMVPILLSPLILLYLLSEGRLVYRVMLTVFAALFTWGLTVWIFEGWELFLLNDLLSTVDALAKITGGEGGSGQEVKADLTDPIQLMRYFPLAFFTALFRPLPGEVMNIFGFLAGMENVVLLILLGRAIIRSELTDFRDPIILSAVTLIVVWTSIYGFISYQNLGGAVRFKLQILPVLLLVLLYLGRWRGLRRTQSLGAPRKHNKLAL